MSELPKKRRCYQLTLYEILTVACAAAIPIALGIYTGISSEEQRQYAEQTRQFDLKQATEARQHALYDKFLMDMYNLEKDGHLNDDKDPWVFANAYHRAAQRQWDAIRKADVLQFLQERKFIGNIRRTEKRSANRSNNIIQLNELNFDQMSLTSQTGSLNPLDMTSISFDQVSMTQSRFLFVNLNETSFYRARLNQAKFERSSLAYATFDSTQLHETDFGHSNLTGARFLNVDLSTAKLTQEQLEQAIFLNSLLPNGTWINSTTTTTKTTAGSITTEQTYVTTEPSSENNDTTAFYNTTY